MTVKVEKYERWTLEVPAANGLVLRLSSIGDGNLADEKDEDQYEVRLQVVSPSADVSSGDCVVKFGDLVELLQELAELEP
jgi:hypothetical protein